MSKNLISINDVTDSQVESILKQAEIFLKKNRGSDKTVKDLDGKILMNFFFENSTRTRTSFEIAAKRLGAKVINIDISLSSLKKKETVIDTAKTINVMHPDFVAIRHNSSGMVKLLSSHLDANVINAGDGANEHPTQALLDLFTIKQHKSEIKDLKVTICGDVLHSRVARSNISLLSRFGAKISIVMPQTLITNTYEKWVKDNFNAQVFDSLENGIKDADVVMMLRIQAERMSGCYFPSNEEYFKLFGLTHEKLKIAKKDVIVLHPGPINRDVEISSKLADDESKSLILNQVEAGVAVRQAILKFLAN
jgi:aspartate carbamoyltransferase catalytic subunit